jgi:hypothetical protein
VGAAAQLDILDRRHAAVAVRMLCIAADYADFRAVS